MDLFSSIQPQFDPNGNPIVVNQMQGAVQQGYPVQGYPQGVPMDGMQGYPQCYPQGMPSPQYNNGYYSQMQQGYPQGYEVQGYGMQGYGMPQMRKPSVSEVYRNLAQYVCSVTGTMPVTTIKLEETPQKMRHACIEAGISNLEKNIYSVPEFGITVEYYYCKACCKLFVQGEVYI